MIVVDGDDDWDDEWWLLMIVDDEDDNWNDEW
jgi:hypothetical protein